LSKSAISGEYLFVPDFELTINKFIKNTSNELDPSVITSETGQSKIIVKFNELNTSIGNTLRHYQALVEFAKNKFNTFSQDNRYSSFRTKSEIDNQLYLFVNYTFRLCKFDYHLPIKEDDFYQLLYISTELKELIGKSNRELREIYSILLHKCNFTIRRIKHEAFDYSLDFVIETINPEELEIGELSLFLEEAIHEVDVKFENTYLDEIKKNNCNLKSFVFLIKYYQKNLKDKSGIDKIDYVIERFDKFFKTKEKTQSYQNPLSLLDNYDKFAINSVYNYIYNCRFSFITKHGELSIKEIKSNLRKIEDVQHKTGVFNFHPYEKAIIAIIQCINRHLKSDVYEENLINEKTEELNRLIIKYEDAIKWSKSHKFFPFQLNFSESICSFENGISVFTPSAYAKIIDYREQDKNLVKFKQNSEFINFHIDLSKDRMEIEHHRGSIESIKNNINQSEKRLYELVGLFAAVITFLFGTINIFTANNTSLPQLLVNTSGLGIILLLFLAVFVSTSPIFVQRDLNISEFLKSRRFVIPSISVIIYVLLIIFFSCDLNDRKTNLKETKQNVSNKNKSLKDSTQTTTIHILNILSNKDSIKSTK
jgi:hypothetical protein